MKLTRYSKNNFCECVFSVGEYKVFQPNMNARGLDTAVSDVEVDDGLRRYMLNIYNHMGLALIISGLVAFFAAQSEAYVNALYIMDGSRIIGMNPLGWVVALSPLAAVMVLSFGQQRLSLNGARLAFFGFSILMGLSLVTIALSYTGSSIARVFFITAATFGVMSLYGYTTKRDLTKLGNFLMMAVIGLIIASLVNIFLKSSMLQFALSALGVLVFTGLTAYDTQKLKHMYYELAAAGEAQAKLVIIGALTLYLDFINIFTSLMHLLGERKE
jgi:uncharacterized protein